MSDLSAVASSYERIDSFLEDQRQKWELIGRGEGLHWEDLDEETSMKGFLAGRMDRSHPGAREA